MKANAIQIVRRGGAHDIAGTVGEGVMDVRHPRGEIEMWTRSLHGAARAVAVALAVILVTASAQAAPPPPPGGHLAVYYGGDNSAGYPALTLTGGEVPEADAIPARLVVANAPNPFRGQTLLRFPARQNEILRLRVFTIEGRQVREMVAIATRTGPQQIAWDGRDKSGKLVPTGVYFYTLVAGKRSASGRLVFMK